MWKFLYLHFEGSAAEAFVKKIRKQNPGLVALDRESPPIRMALQLQRRMTENGRLEKYEGGEFLYRFLCALLRETEKGTGSGNTSLTEQAEIYMRERYQTIQGIEEVGPAFVGVSPAHRFPVLSERAGHLAGGISDAAKTPVCRKRAAGNREKCGDHRPRKRFFQWKLFRKSLPPVYGRQSRQLSGKTPVRSKNGALQD